MPKKRTRNYEIDTLYDAYFACTQEGMPVSKAAKIYKVPRSTLNDRVKGLTQLEKTTSGPNTLLSEMEEWHFAQHIKKMKTYVQMFPVLLNKL